MNLLRPITIDSAGNERNDNVFVIIKPENGKFHKIRGKNFLKLCMSNF